MNTPAVPDPRDIITPDAFAVAPHLLGRPLAKPWRRGVAMLIDLLLVALLVNAGGVFFGIAAAMIFFRMSRRTSSENARFPRSSRVIFRGAAALALFITCVSLWGRVRDGTEDRAVEAAQRAAANLEGAGTAREQLPRTLPEIAQDTADQPLPAQALRTVADSLGARAVAADTILEGDSILRAYVASLDQDSAAAVRLRPHVVAAVAEDTIAALQGRLQRMRLQNAALREAAVDQGEDPGLLHMIRIVADDLGLGFGWVGLYFTAFLALWRGQTPGKRLLRLRVLRLNGAPVSWWASFERFGGYAAGLLTGLLGFAQIWWDRNRQAIHDKISETVVVQE